jgi:hypothetical protein
MFDCCNKGKYEVIPALNYQALRHEDVWGTGGIAPPFFT